jgi:hypothetical protein
VESVEKIPPDMVMKPKSPKIDQDRMVSPYTDRIMRALTFDLPRPRACGRPILNNKDSLRARKLKPLTSEKTIEARISGRWLLAEFATETSIETPTELAMAAQYQISAVSNRLLEHKNAFDVSTPWPESTSFNEFGTIGLGRPQKNSKVPYLQGFPPQRASTQKGFHL